MAIATRRHTNHALEMTREMALVIKTNHERDLSDGDASAQQGFGPLHAQLVEIGVGWQAKSAFEGAQ